MVTFQVIAKAIVSATDDEMQVLRKFIRERMKVSTSSQDHSCEQIQLHLR
jgi:hypothetical protein